MADRSHKMHLLSWYLDGELPPIERQAMEVHLRVCAVCQQELALLRQTVNALRELPLETTPADFVEKLNRRIERETELRHLLEAQQRFSRALAVGRNPAQETLPLPVVLREPSGAVLAQRVPCWRRFLCAPLYVRIPIYAGVAVLGLAVLLLRASPQKTKTTPTSPATRAPLLPRALPQRVASVDGKTVQPVETPVDTVVSAPEEFPTSVAPPSSPTGAPALNMAETLAWRVAGSEPAMLREQVKALAEQMAEAVIVEEEEHMLLLSLPTQRLSELHQELTKLAEVSAPKADVIPNAPTTLLQVTFVGRLSVVSPPVPERLPGRS